MPPRGISPRRSSVASIRARPWRICAAYPPELLAERHRDRVHQVRASGLDHVRELRRLGLERLGETAERREEVAGDLSRCREVDGRGEHVVRRLAEVHMVVRMHAVTGEGRHDLVRVHVRGGAGAGLEDVDRKLVVELAGGDAVARGGDALREPGIEEPEVGVGPRPAALIRPSQWTTGAGIGCPETGKLETALAVSPPQSSFGTVSLIRCILPGAVFVLAQQKLLRYTETMPVGTAAKVEALTTDFKSAAAVADMLGVSRSRVTRWLKGEGIDPLNAERVDLLELVWSNLLRIYEQGRPAHGCSGSTRASATEGRRSDPRRAGRRAHASHPRRARRLVRVILHRCFAWGERARGAGPRRPLGSPASTRARAATTIPRSTAACTSPTRKPRPSSSSSPASGRRKLLGGALRRRGLPLALAALELPDDWAESVRSRRPADALEA